MRRECLNDAPVSLGDIGHCSASTLSAAASEEQTWLKPRLATGQQASVGQRGMGNGKT